MMIQKKDHYTSIFARAQQFISENLLASMLHIHSVENSMKSPFISTISPANAYCSIVKVHAPVIIFLKSGCGYTSFPATLNTLGSILSEK